MTQSAFYFFHIHALIVFVYSIRTSALITLNVKQYSVTLLKLLKSKKSYKYSYIVSPIFRYFKKLTVHVYCQYCQYTCTVSLQFIHVIFNFLIILEV